LYRRSDLPFDRVVDLRAHRGRQSPIGSLLRLMVVAIACGHRKLRELEALSQSMPPRLRRMVGLRGGGVSDTALYETLVRTPQVGFQQALFQQVRTELDRKAIGNDLFPQGVISYDGKCAGWGKGQRPNALCQRGFFNYGAEASWRLFALRACLTSSSARPVLNQQFLTVDGEATAFGPMFVQDVKQFPRLFRYVTADAGITSVKNAATVVSVGKHYLFALKGNHKRLYELALDSLADVPVEHSTSERYRGQLVIRQLRRVDVPAYVDFAGAAQFVSVTTTRIDAKQTTQSPSRVFITSVPAAELSPRKLMTLVRCHWLIENGANWTADTILLEDTHCPCKTGWGLVVCSWLNLLAYNLLSVFRSRLPQRDGRPPAWRDVATAIYHALVDWQPIRAISQNV
jgi:predicted transposase YbfD/YdcC